MEYKQAHTWNVEVLIDVLKELVSTCNHFYIHDVSMM